MIKPISIDTDTFEIAKTRMEQLEFKNFSAYVRQLIVNDAEKKKEVKVEPSVKTEKVDYSKIEAFIEKSIASKLSEINNVVTLTSGKEEVCDHHFRYFNDYIMLCEFCGETKATDRSISKINTEKESVEIIPQIEETNTQEVLSVGKETKTEVSLQVTPESKLKNKKTRAIKEKKQILPANEAEVIEYYTQRGAKNAKELGKNFFDYYSVADWIDSEGKTVLNWKQKAISFERNNKKYSDNRSTRKDKAPIENSETAIKLINAYKEQYETLNSGSIPLISEDDKHDAEKLYNHLLELAKDETKAINSIKYILTWQRIWGKMYKSKNNISHILKHFNVIIDNIKGARTYIEETLVTKRIMVGNPNYEATEIDINNWIEEYENKK